MPLQQLTITLTLTVFNLTLIFHYFSWTNDTFPFHLTLPDFSHITFRGTFVSAHCLAASYLGKQQDSTDIDSSFRTLWKGRSHGSKTTWKFSKHKEHCSNERPHSTQLTDVIGVQFVLHPSSTHRCQCHSTMTAGHPSLTSASDKMPNDTTDTFTLINTVQFNLDTRQ